MQKTSIIMPVFNEETCLDTTLAAVHRLNGAFELIVVDGGSSDASAEIAKGRAATVLTSEASRGRQMSRGVAVAGGDILWFLHADTLPRPDALEQISMALQSSDAVAGSFDVKFDGTSLSGMFLTVVYRCLRRLGFCYGDSAIFVRTSTYHAIGGFKDFPIFEDLDFVRRLKRQGRFLHLRSQVMTSARRFENRSFVITFARWTWLQILYCCGMHPSKLGQMYAPIRQKTTET